MTKLDTKKEAIKMIKTFKKDYSHILMSDDQERLNEIIVCLEL
jgi:hypothetical protein